MVLQHKENFASWDNLTKSTAFFVQDSDPCEFSNFFNYAAGTFYHVQTDALPAVFTGSTARTCYFRIRHESAGSAWLVANGAGFYLYDGSNYLIIELIEVTSTSSKARIYVYYGDTQRTNTSGTNVATTTTLDIMTRQDSWFWVKIDIDASDNIIISYVDTNTTIKPDDADWIEHSELNSLSHDMNTITEMGVFVENKAGSNADDEFKWDDLEIITGEGVPIDNSVVDGTTIKLSSVYVKKTIGQVGSKARLTYHDPILSLGPTVETAHRTVTTISETKFNTRMLQGEIVNTGSMTKEIIVNGVEAKLARTIAAYDPVFTKGTVEYINGNTLYKQNVGTNKSPVFSSYGSLADKLIVFIKTDNRFYQCGVDAAAAVDSGDVGITPDLTTGSINNLFFDAPEESDANRSLYYRNDGRFFITLTFVALVKDTSVVDKANISVRWASSSRVVGNEPAMNLWDYTNSVWRTFTNHEHKDLTTDLNEGNDDGFIESIIVNQQVNIEQDITTGVFADYSSVSAANTYGWKTHTFKVRLDSGTTILAINNEIIHIEEANLKLNLDIDQQYQVGVGKIQTVNDHNLVLYGNAAVSWLDEDVRDDGISGGGVDVDGVVIGDAYFITDKISDIVTALWSASGADLIMNLNISLTSEIPDIEDLRRVMILQYVQKISELLGAIYWTSYTTDPVNDLPTFNITDTPVDTGQTWTDADFIEPMKQTTYKIDSSKELSTLKLIGKAGLIGEVSITSEHTPELGLETVLVPRPDIHTARQATSWLSKKKLLYTNAYRYFSCRINYDRANQDYSVADIGKEVTIKNPADASIVDHQSGTNGRLLIYQMELNRNWNNGYSNYMTFILQQRFA